MAHATESARRMAADLAGRTAAEVTLRRPPPLATAMTIERAGEGSVRVLHGGTLVAECIRLPDGLALELPDPVSIPEARALLAPDPGCGPTPKNTPFRPASCAGRIAHPGTDCTSWWDGSRAG